MSRTDKDTPAWVRARRLPANYGGHVRTSEGYLSIMHDGCEYDTEPRSFWWGRVRYHTVYAERPADWHYEEYEVPTGSYTTATRTRLAFGPYRVPVDTVVEHTFDPYDVHPCDMGGGSQYGTDCTAWDFGRDRYHSRNRHRGSRKYGGRNLYHTTRRAEERLALRDARYGDFERADRLAPNGRDITKADPWHWD